MSTEAPNNSTSTTVHQMKDYNVVAQENSTSYGIINIDDKHKKALQFIEDVTINADEIQKQVLYEILSTNAQVEYLQRHGLDGHTDRESFKKVVPVVTYEDLKPDITRIANGDTSPILCAHPISQFFSSSGTSGGEFKLMPAVNSEEQSERRHLFFSLATPIISQYIPGQEKGKGMYFKFVKEETKTPGGLVQRTAVTGLLKSSQFKERPHDYFGNLTSPYETLLCVDSYQSMYSQLLCGLYQNNQVLRVGAVYAYGFILMISFLQQHWTLLSNDIRTGTLDAQITDPSVREAVLIKVLTKPNPELADFIEAECSKDSWRGIITRLWPNTKYMDAVIVGCGPYDLAHGSLNLGLKREHIPYGP